ncbi:hypothetical protein KY359_03635, partial [Candidatus Woesearchaeota archaeon]|nr:hypothetical protein [Candidatus Woesearchaeota archaeon]
MMDQKTERVIYELGKGTVQVLAITIPKESNIVGKPAEIKNSIIGAIYRDGELMLPKEGTKLKEEDVLILTAKTKNLKSITKQIYGTAKWK